MRVTHTIPTGQRGNELPSGHGTLVFIRLAHGHPDAPQRSTQWGIHRKVDQHQPSGAQPHVVRATRRLQDHRRPTPNPALTQNGTIDRQGPLAQRLEPRTHNPLVVGSNPTGPTKILLSGPDAVAVCSIRCRAFINLRAKERCVFQLAACLSAFFMRRHRFSC